MYGGIKAPRAGAASKMINTPRYCRYCGGKLTTPDDRYCVNCGQATLVSSPVGPSDVPTLPSGPQGIYRSPKARSTWALVLFAVHVLVIVISFASTVAEINLLQRMVDGEFVTQQELIANDDRQAAIGFMVLVAAIALVVAFSMWVHRASKNLRALNAAGQRFSPGWAVGWWFVPIMNLFKPYQVVREIWRGSDPSVTQQDRQAWQNAPLTAMLGWWWAIWIVSSILDSILVVSLVSNDLTAEQLITWNYWSLVADALIIVAAALAFMLVRAITANQEAKHLRLTAGGHF